MRKSHICLLDEHNVAWQLAEDFQQKQAEQEQVGAAPFAPEGFHRVLIALHG